MSVSLKERLALQREAVAATDAGAKDDFLLHDKSRDDKSRVSSPSEEMPVTAARAVEPDVEAPTRTQGIPISASDDAIIAEMQAFCRRRKIKVRRNSNVSLITRAGWRLLYELMQKDPTAFAAAIEAGRPPRQAST